MWRRSPSDKATSIKVIVWVLPYVDSVSGSQQVISINSCQTINNPLALYPILTPICFVILVDAIVLSPFVLAYRKHPSMPRWPSPRRTCARGRPRTAISRMEVSFCASVPSVNHQQNFQRAIHTPISHYFSLPLSSLLLFCPVFLCCWRQRLLKLLDWVLWFTLDWSSVHSLRYHSIHLAITSWSASIRCSRWSSPLCRCTLYSWTHG